MSVPGFDPLTGTLALPLWAAGVLAVLLLVLGALAIRRAGFRGGLISVALVLLAVIPAWLFVETNARQDRAAARRALDARAATLAARATMPGSPLACLDALAGDVVEGACERTLFATPEAMAAAVSYVAAQWSLLSDTSTFARTSKDRGLESLLVALRRSLESDRYGLVAHVLATRDGCDAVRCAALALLRDKERVKANLAQGTYEAHVTRHAASWPAPAAGQAPVAAASPPPAAATQATLPPGANAFAAPRIPGPDVFFPSSDSIPPVNIMTAEPPVREPETTGGGGTARPQPQPQPAQRKAAPAAPKQAAPAPMDLNAAARGTPAP